MPWAVNVAPGSTSATVLGTTGVSKAFASSVAAGDVIAVVSLFQSSTGSLVPTFTDTSGNVASWTSHSVQFTSVAGVYLGIGWGLATANAACTPKVTWNEAVSHVMELFVGDFTPPAGTTVSEDGAVASDDHTVATTSITTPTGNGDATTDHLVFGMVGCGASFTAWGGAWTAMGPVAGDDAGYIVNSAGNVAMSATQNASNNYASIVLALQAVATGLTSLTAYLTSTNSTIL